RKLTQGNQAGQQLADLADGSLIRRWFRSRGGDCRGDQARSGQDPLGSAALEGQFGRRLAPTVTDLAEHGSVGHEHVGEVDFVEMMLARHGGDGTDGETGRRARYQKLAQAGVPIRRIGWATTGKHDDGMREMRTT